MFQKTKRKRRFKTVNWETLEQGDYIKIIGGHGPYMIINDKKHRIGVPSGRYKVKRLVNEGILVLRDNSYTFVYMGPVKKTMLGFSEPHKFKKILT